MELCDLCKKPRENLNTQLVHTRERLQAIERQAGQVVVRETTYGRFRDHEYRVCERCLHLWGGEQTFGRVTGTLFLVCFVVGLGLFVLFLVSYDPPVGPMAALGSVVSIGLAALFMNLLPVQSRLKARARRVHGDIAYTDAEFKAPVKTGGSQEWRKLL